MKYEVKLSKNAQKQLSQIASYQAERILVKTYALAHNPFPPSSKSLAGQPGYRLRIGNYRVLYEVYRHELIIQVIRIGHRKEVYRVK
ncbi:MAG: type II toxin-antitoxin system RelE family toxin [Candidatus Saccharimonadales bacterium]